MLHPPRVAQRHTSQVSQQQHFAAEKDRAVQVMMLPAAAFFILTLNFRLPPPRALKCSSTLKYGIHIPNYKSLGNLTLHRKLPLHAMLLLLPSSKLRCSCRRRVLL
jgi:hypothetical protein